MEIFQEINEISTGRRRIAHNKYYTTESFLGTFEFFEQQIRRTSNKMREKRHTYQITEI
jgi:hypothetical protein